MADDRYLEEYTRSLGSPTQLRDQQVGTWQAATGQTCSQQQSWEPHDSYINRVNAYDYAKNNNR